MKNAAHTDDLREPILTIDAKVRDMFAPYRGSAPIMALSWFSKLGDQPELRIASAAVIAAGLFRRDQRLVGAGVRMLAAHELATASKNFVKRRVDRVRPRTASTREESKPRPGRSTAKERTSFPSGHSAGSMAVARAISRGYPRLSARTHAAAGAVALAQIPRCAHYPSDVAAGVAIGMISEALVELARRGFVATLRRA